MSRLDPRLNPYRDDLAAKDLIGKVRAERYTSGTLHSCSVNRASLMRNPAESGPMDSELLFGESFTVLENRDGWCWGQSGHDGYVGYIHETGLSPAQENSPTHRVHLPMTLLFPEPSIKSPPLQRLPMNARVTATGQSDRFLETDSGYVIAAHMVEHQAPLREDFVSVAGLFMFVPYLWGGRTHEGIDCSGLVQTALNACLVPCPRDSDMQEARLGTAIDPKAPRQRGDLVFWKGHVGIMISSDRLLHANATAMFTSIDMIDELEARLLPTEGPVTSVRRL